MLIMIGYATEEGLRELWEMGYADVTHKNFTVASLEETARRALEEN